ncbi:hypothetical protein JCM10212_005761 [Sporobolomyces blumeae]
MSPMPSCRACSKTPVEGERFLVCSRCLARTNDERKTYYCSKTCQTLDWPLHKPTICGTPPSNESARTERSGQSNPSVPRSPLDLAAADKAPGDPEPTEHVLFHLATLKTLSTKLSKPDPFSTGAPGPRSTGAAAPPPPPLAPTPSYLFFPTDPLAPSSKPSSSTSSSSSSSSKGLTLPIPIHLPLPSHNLFVTLFSAALSSKKDPALSVTLMYSLLITTIEALEGSEERLVEQLGQEFRLDGRRREGEEEVGEKGRRKTLRDHLNEDREPTHEELVEAIGGEENMNLLVEWQMEEAERLRQPGSI